MQKGVKVFSKKFRGFLNFYEWLEQLLCILKPGRLLLFSSAESLALSLAFSADA